MPQPPRKGESKKDWISRCAGDEASVSEFPDIKQRLAYCYSMWERRKAKASYVLKNGEDEIIYIRAETLLPEPLVTKLKTLPQSGPGYHDVKVRYEDGTVYSGRVIGGDTLETYGDEIEDQMDEMVDIELND